jgi:hypothetical protein
MIVQDDDDDGDIDGFWMEYNRAGRLAAILSPF